MKKGSFPKVWCLFNELILAQNHDQEHQMWSQNSELIRAHQAKMRCYFILDFIENNRNKERSFVAEYFEI